jgi:hypothetical protein
MRPVARQTWAVLRPALVVGEPSSEEFRQRRREYNSRPDVRARNLASQRKYRATPEGRAKKRARQRAYYHCTPEAYQSMVEAQDGKCAICLCPPAARFNGRIKQLAVDHDHETGKIRALLCDRCNAGLGYFRNNPTFLLAAVAYLDRHASSYIRAFTT